jgi:hypothetical protein
MSLLDLTWFLLMKKEIKKHIEVIENRRGELSK